MASDPKYCSNCGASTHNTSECPGKANKETLAVSHQQTWEEKVCGSADEADYAGVESMTEFNARMRYRELEWDADPNTTLELEYALDGGLYLL